MTRSLALSLLFVVPLLVLSLVPFCSKADSPITSTVFHTVYQEYSPVARAKDSGRLDSIMIDFLLDDQVVMGAKAALINALSWDNKGKKNTSPFVDRLRHKYKLGEENLYLDKLTAGELMCLGYLMVMDDYFNPAGAIPVLEMARDKAPKSQTVHTVLALVLSQALLNQDDWCGIWLTCSEVFANKDLEPDLEEEALLKIRQYIEVYRESC